MEPESGLIWDVWWWTPVLPRPQRQNMPNCVSEYAKQDKNMPIFFATKNTWKIGNKIV